MTLNQHLSKVTLVIPTTVTDLRLAISLVTQDCMDLFGRIVVVVSGVRPDSEDSLYSSLLLNIKRSNLSFVCVQQYLHPGEARNLGYDSVTTDYVSFLDVRTLPSPAWFDALSEFVHKKKADLMLCAVKFVPTSFLAEVFAAATYGFLPLTCLPGSILSSDVFVRTGRFITARSGEDSEWILRARLIGLDILECDSPPLLEYKLNVSANNLKGLIYKWFRNYSVSFNLPGYKAHKYIYALFGTAICLMTVYMWNWRIAGWNEASPLYLPFITRVASGVVAAAYIAFRGFYLPIAKGVFNRPHPGLLIFCSFPLAFFLDLVKILSAFSSVFFKYPWRIR